MRQYYVPRVNVITFAMHMLNLIIIIITRDEISSISATWCIHHLSNNLRQNLPLYPGNPYVILYYICFFIMLNNDIGLVDSSDCSEFAIDSSALICNK